MLILFSAAVSPVFAGLWFDWHPRSIISEGRRINANFFIFCQYYYRAAKVVKFNNSMGAWGHGGM
jgi:hypothetical protein